MYIRKFGREPVSLDFFAHEKPALRILEVGGGTGDVTANALNYLQAMDSRTGSIRISEYISLTFVPASLEAQLSDGTISDMNFQCLQHRTQCSWPRA